jgi:hypothetical protein
MGHNLKAAILLGKTENYVNVANELHMCVVILISSEIEIFSIGSSLELCNISSTNSWDTGTLTKHESKATSICPQILLLGRSFSSPRTLGFATHKF